MKGICFKEPLFHAVVDGSKTQTRRLVTPNPFTDESKPRYNMGETLYLKEPHFESDTGLRVYKYGYPASVPTHYENIPSVDEISWQNKLFMPESAARYFIKITAVRCEQLKTISEDDCYREGIKRMGCFGFVHGLDSMSVYRGKAVRSVVSYVHPVLAYADLIDKISGKGTWESNPFVWVYDFELLK